MTTSIPLNFRNLTQRSLCSGEPQAGRKGRKGKEHTGIVHWMIDWDGYMTLKSSLLCFQKNFTTSLIDVAVLFFNDAENLKVICMFFKLFNTRSKFLLTFPVGTWKFYSPRSLNLGLFYLMHLYCAWRTIRLPLILQNQLLFFLPNLFMKIKNTVCLWGREINGLQIAPLRVSRKP